MSVTVTSYLPPLVRLPRLLAGTHRPYRLSLEEHIAEHGPMVIRGHDGRDRPERFIDVVERAGLTGRGGAGFPTGRKMRAVRERRGPAVLVANGCEGEPASGKDRLLLTRVPHLVLDGIAVAADAVGATEAYLAVHGSAEEVTAAVQAALAERDQAGIDRLDVSVAPMPRRYVSSEQSAIVNFLNGGPAKPTFAPPRPHERGVRGRPTLVNNVETLAHLGLIARYGDEWFRSVGLPWAPGSMLVTVGGALPRPGVYEIEMGTTIGDVLTEAGGPTEDLRAVLVGGYFGTWLDVDVAWGLPLTHMDLRQVGAGLGAGIVIALPWSSCVLAETARVVRFLAEENAAQCGPCMFGLPALADRVAEIAFQGSRGRGGLIEEIQRLLALIERRGACRHPDGATQLVRTALNAAYEDAQWHEMWGSCDGVGRTPMLPLPADAERGWEWK